MRLCFPVESTDGTEHRIFPHFGLAPAYLIVDSDTLHREILVNQDVHHVRGCCNPINTIAGANIDGVIVLGIGASAVTLFQMRNIPVLRSPFPIVADAIREWTAGRLGPMKPSDACPHHGQNPSCPLI